MVITLSLILVVTNAGNERHIRLFFYSFVNKLIIRFLVKVIPKAKTLRVGLSILPSRN